MSIVILSIGAMAVMQALARAAYAMTVVQQYTNAHLFATSKMAGLELAVRSGETLKDHEDGSFQAGGQSFQWEVAAAPAGDDPALQSVSLVVSWRYGPNVYERRVDTLLKTPETP